MEEPLFGLIIPLCLIATGRSILFAASISTSLRVAFHIYYGWSSPLLGIWAFVAVIIVLRTGAIIGVIVTHILFSTVQSLAHMFPAAPDAVAPISLALLIVVVPFATTWTFTCAFGLLKDDGLPLRSRIRAAGWKWINIWLSRAAPPVQPARASE